MPVFLFLFLINCVCSCDWIELVKFKFLVGMLLLILSSVVCMTLTNTLLIAL